ncbi:tetratricopeptide repeat protein [Leptospira idonii]|uniref:Uncharacterized protein n=1 Tax=Leptospira idonii TaxID=1193500 RepID=A0A4R9LZK0_9LEPT|nr:tetratricopeptide repeat protein [Leptospira idonii]TGN19793.1 hypothetical protein EHS15_07030 [Leptospira idonii]
MYKKLIQFVLLSAFIFSSFYCKDKDKAIDHYAKGIEYYSKKKLEKAIIEFSEAASADSSFLPPRLMKGKSEYYLGKYEDALKTFQTIESDYPGNAASLTWIGKIYMLSSDKRTEAKKYLTLAVQYDDNQIDSHYYLGKLFEQEGNVKDALIQYNHGIEISKRVDKIKRDLVEIYKNAGLDYESLNKPSVTPVASSATSVKKESKKAK